MPLPPIQGVPRLRRDIWANHQGSVFTLLGDKAPPVICQGVEFKHQGWWTLRLFVGELCKWAHENPGCCPTRADVSKWVIRVNTSKKPQEIIFIAVMPPRPTLRLALGIKGGLYHECFHGIYSRSRPLKLTEMQDLVLPRWAKVADWSKHFTRLLEWQNVCEDIRIERCGVVDYPGVVVKMHDLQDIILGLEVPSDRISSIVLRTYRDVGLGYNTLAQREALANYRLWNEDAVQLVLDGPMSPLLRENIALDAEDDLSSLRLAMDVIATLADLVEGEVPPPSAGQPQCPSCGAPGDKLRLHPMSDGRGGQVPGKGLMTCTVCGFQVEVDLEAGGGASDDTDPDEAVPSEDPDAEGEPEEGTGGGQSEDSDGEEGDDPDDSDDDSDGDAEPGDADDPGGSGGRDPDDGDDPDSSPDGDDGDEETEEEGEDDVAGAEGASGEPEEPEELNTPSGDDDDDDDDDDDEGEGGEGTTPEAPVDPWDDAMLEVAAELLGDDTKSDIEDVSTALGQETEDEREGASTECGPDELPWMPFDLSLDQVLMVGPSSRGQSNDRIRSRRLREKIRLASAFIRAQIRIRITKLKKRKTQHGVRLGRGLSERNLVHTKVALEAGRPPSRAYWKQGRRVDTSMAVAVVVDQSESMGWNVQVDTGEVGANGPITVTVSKKVLATEAMAVLTEPFDNLGIPVQVSGLRLSPMDWTEFRRRYKLPPPPPFHRAYGITHDIFKLFEEPFAKALWRFGNMRAEGGTPLADGVQFGLDCLEDRPEKGKILFIVTDGQPAPGHSAIMKSQFRIAESLGIHVVGVGMGPGTEYVEGLFPDSVYAADLGDLARKLILKVDSLLLVEGFTSSPGSYSPAMSPSS